MIFPLNLEIKYRTTPTLLFLLLLGRPESHALINMLVTAKYYAILAAFMLAVVNAQDTSSSVEVTTARTATAGTDTATDTGSAAAPSSSNTAGISPCILSCVQPAATKNGCVLYVARETLPLY